MTITWLVCPCCGHRFGSRIALEGPTSCPACYEVATRPGWAAADADDLCIYYTRGASGLETTPAGQANRYI